MLVLTRKVGQSILINGDVQLTVLSIKGHQVRIGTQAPKHVTVNRAEVRDRYAKKQRERLASNPLLTQEAKNDETADSQDLSQ